MFTKLDRTIHLPGEKPIMAWDGNCGFCHYWVLRWKMFTGDKVIYKPFTDVAHKFPDIELRFFKQAVRFIDVDGRIYTGPAAAFQSFQYGDRYRWIMPLYRRWKLVEFIADHTYRFVSKNRPVMYKISVALWGKNPIRQKPYWLYYAGTLALVITGLVVLL